MRDLTPSDFPFLASLAASERQIDRSIWLRVSTDHFVATRPGDPDRRAAFAAAMIPALKSAEPAMQLEVARKLASCPQTPLAILDWFAGASSEISELILEQASAFTEADLRAAAARDPRAAAAVARRGDLSPGLVDALIDLNQADALVALAENLMAPLAGEVFVRFAWEARRRAGTGDARLANALIKRRPVAAEGAVLFLEADPPTRGEILLAAQRRQLGRPPGLPPVDESALERLETASVRRRPDDFVAALAEALGCESDLAQRIVGDPSGEPLAVALAAIGAPNDALVRMLISNDLDAGGFRRIRALARLNAALNRNAAVAVMDFLRGDRIVPNSGERPTAGLARPFSRPPGEARRPDRPSAKTLAASA